MDLGSIKRGPDLLAAGSIEGDVAHKRRCGNGTRHLKDAAPCRCGPFGFLAAAVGAILLGCLSPHETKNVVVNIGRFVKRLILPLVIVGFVVPLTVDLAAVLCIARNLPVVAQRPANGLGRDRGVNVALPKQLLQSCDVAFVLTAIVGGSTAIGQNVAVQMKRHVKLLKQIEVDGFGGWSVVPLDNNLLLCFRC